MRGFTSGKVLDEIFWLIVAPVVGWGLALAVTLEVWLRGPYSR